MINTVIGNWSIERLLGEGGMGEVYLARHKHLGTMAALKILSTSLTREPKFRERFFQEAQTQAQLVHPHIARVIDFIEQDGLFCQVSEYLPGGTLGDILQNRRPVPLPLALRWTKQTLSALENAHSKGVVHRDIKPSNILLDQDGNAKLTDFGIALVLGQRRFTTTGKTIGTPEYMSPEQITSPKSVDTRSDIYSVGVVLFELLTGSSPFQGESDFTIYQAQVAQPSPKLRQFNPSAPRELEEIVSKALRKKPGSRYQRCAEMLAALQEFEGRRALPPTRVAIRRTVTRRYGKWILMSLGVALVLVVLVYVWSLQKQSLNYVERDHDVATIPAAGRASMPATPGLEIAFRERLLATLQVNDEVGSISPEFSPGGDRVAYSVKDIGGERLVLNASRGQIFDNIYGLRFSPDGSKIAYYASKGSRLFVMVNEHTNSIFNSIPNQLKVLKGGLVPWERPDFDPSGDRVLYIAPSRGAVRLVSEKWEGPLFDRVEDYAFTGDGSTVAYIATKGSKEFVMSGEWSGPAYDNIYSLVVSAGGRVAYAAMRGKSCFVVSGDWRSEAYDFIHSISLSKDGRRLMYIARRGSKDYVAIDGAIFRESERLTKETPEREFISVETVQGIDRGEVSEDGAHYAYSIKRDGKEAYVIDGSMGSQFDEVSRAAFSPDGTAVGYAAKVGDKWMVVCGDKRGEAVDQIQTIRFSADGRQIGYGARIGRELWWKVLDVN